MLLSIQPDLTNKIWDEVLRRLMPSVWRQPRLVTKDSSPTDVICMIGGYCIACIALLRSSNSPSRNLENIQISANKFSAGWITSKRDYPKASAIAFLCLLAIRSRGSILKMLQPPHGKISRSPGSTPRAKVCQRLPVHGRTSSHLACRPP